MYEELVKRLREYAKEHCPLDRGSGICGCIDAREAADAIEELGMKLHGDEAAIAGMKREIERMVVAGKPRWIPVTERLPDCEHGAEIGNIEWISCGMVHAGCFGRGGKYRDAYFRTWTDAGEGMDAKDADYWRAVMLPEPPKEET